LQWECTDEEEWTIQNYAVSDSNIIKKTLKFFPIHQPILQEQRYFYHTDHLGSSSWITDSLGMPIQFIHYQPYGELYINYKTTAFDERFKFTGKERDAETDYDYFGARYYASICPSFISVDPLADKYPGLNPYAYCAWNPIMYVDPDGMDWYQDEEGNIKWTNYGSQEEMDLNMVNGTYIDKVVVAFYGSLNEKLGKGYNLFTEGANLASAIVYGYEENDIETYPAFTMSSNYSLYGAIDDGTYSVYNKKNKNGPLGSGFSVNNGGPINCINGVNPSPIHPYSKTQKNGIWIHRSNKNGDMLPYKNGIAKPLSTGCLIIAPTKYDNAGNVKQKGWDQFVRQIGNINKFTIILKRQ
ncbi:MAG: RHS repeat-associated core domain-containing protein, partial [Paludibacteraceae bacterium]|nr:RHS repeat-associated core domain-containing protein [Paludibacteraceae bacterium]